MGTLADDLGLSSPEELRRFADVLLNAASNSDLVAELDRLKGTNLSLRGSPIARY